MIGIHRPEFAFEKETGNVQTAIKHFGIYYFIAQDNSYATWKAYNNQIWTAKYFIDRNANIEHKQLGESNYDHA